LGPVIK